MNRAKFGLENINEIAGNTKAIKKDILERILSENGDLVKEVVFNSPKVKSSLKLNPMRQNKVFYQYDS